ncbi:metallophosphoesterase [Amycolatopsis azurea]|uniref:Metallophosphoesterase n=1 Tax=Amycolatopsis azurea DSM 43854 TaxID=1238180 RepID=M2PUA1_9PSEU|nr:metallophosphoesterase [Amycolatopsis azurea]EMD23120.1 metallophosphoesterase [Amycolatopsis azurea DSM 43854]OOC01189.1 metallophosphoesterase [Amycolatopsis azurea DSM 43854]
MPRILARVAALIAVLALLFGVPWWTIIGSPELPAALEVLGTIVFAAAVVVVPASMILGHGPWQRDVAAKIGDLSLGLIWLLFSLSILGNVLRLVLALSGVDSAAGIVSGVVLVAFAALAAYGMVEARRVPRLKELDVVIPRLGAGLDGLRFAIITDTHFGPLNRTKWSEKVVEVVNELDADVVAHAGDLADGSVAKRAQQVAPLGKVRAKLGKFYITGNHEYFGEAQAWLDHMRDLGWEPLHNRHLPVSQGGDTLVFAGIDDPTGAASGLPGHGPDLPAALDGVAASTPVVLLAHQPKQVKQAAEAGIDLQISGHTHGGQIWPFHLLVRLDQPVLAGLSRHGERTQLYTSRGTGFWGPPLRVFAPSEITLLTLRNGK